MAEAGKAPKNGGQGSGGNGPTSGKGPFSSIAMKEDDGGWFSVMELEDIYGRDISGEEQLKFFSKLKGDVSSSSLPQEKKKMLMDYIKTAERGGDRFSLVHAVGAVMGYINGIYADYEMPFESALMNAWCSRKISGFLEEQREALVSKKEISDEEKGKLNEMIDLALSRKSDTMRGVAAINLNVYYDNTPPETRVDKLENLICTFKAAPAAD